MARPAARASSASGPSLSHRLRRRLGTSDDEHLERFVRATALLTEAAGLLEEMLHHHPERPELRVPIRERRQQADELLARTERELAAVFAAPLDPQRAAPLASALGDLAAAIDDAALVLSLPQLGARPHLVGRQGQALVAILAVLEPAIAEISAREPADVTEDLERLRRASETSYEAALAELMAVPIPTAALVGWKSVLDALRAAAHAALRAAVAADHLRLAG
jgi:hypothetical protein